MCSFVLVCLCLLVTCNLGRMDLDDELPRDQVIAWRSACTKPLSRYLYQRRQSSTQLYGVSMSPIGKTIDVLTRLASLLFFLRNENQQVANELFSVKKKCCDKRGPNTPVQHRVTEEVYASFTSSARSASEWWWHDSCGDWCAPLTRNAKCNCHVGWSFWYSFLRVSF